MNAARPRAPRRSRGVEVGGWALALAGASAAFTPAGARAAGAPAGAASASGGPSAVRFEEAVDFAWNAPPDCPSSSGVVAQAREGLGDLTARALPRVRARGEVSSRNGRWTLTLRTQGPRGEGERTLEADSCAQLADVAALMVGLLVRAELERAAPPERRGTRAPAPGGPPIAPAFRGAARLGALVDGGSLPELAPGLAVAGALERGAWRAEALASAFLPRRQERGPRPGTGGEVGLAAGGVRACYQPFRAFASGWEAGACAGPELGYLWGQGFGLAEVRRSGGVWSALLAGVWVSAPLGRGPLALRVGLEGGRTLRSPRFEIDAFGPVFEASPWLVRAGFGLEWRKP